MPRRQLVTAFLLLISSSSVAIADYRDLDPAFMSQSPDRILSLYKESLPRSGGELQANYLGLLDELHDFLPFAEAQPYSIQKDQEYLIAVRSAIQVKVRASARDEEELAKYESRMSDLHLAIWTAEYAQGGVDGSGEYEEIRLLNQEIEALKTLKRQTAAKIRELESRLLVGADPGHMMMINQGVTAFFRNRLARKHCQFLLGQLPKFVAEEIQ